ncbi:MAG: signal peptidase II [Rothia sp. (in: high G+C Gram-positive bacteria)]|uniref:signal peptidase II n=1 Tax=Rothia sp. (in: high G+C Gram-positive bacteria) TaxID=1885016 RepID=UPI0026E0AB75|nr:signal peptidase II [Rothia sp. (in: high G+C Gram-positive bacteria)]MDO5751110.1 signal peptidase II [Rothia sp. (in: high G+C Gram-positive bacteria)]
MSTTDTRDSEPVTPVLSPRASIILAAVMAALAFGLDQWTKYLVVTHMQLGERITVIDGWLWWYSIRNSGAAFSMGENVTWIFTLIMATVAVYLVVIVRRTRAVYWLLALGGLLGGVLGNLWDRLFREPSFAQGHVVDFISVPNFAIFNVADSFICVCMVAIVLLNFRAVNLLGYRVQQPVKDAAKNDDMSEKNEK